MQGTIIIRHTVAGAIAAQALAELVFNLGFINQDRQRFILIQFYDIIQIYTDQSFKSDYNLVHILNAQRNCKVCRQSKCLHTMLVVRS